MCELRLFDAVVKLTRPLCHGPLVTSTGLAPAGVIPGLDRDRSPSNEWLAPCAASQHFSNSINNRDESTGSMLSTEFIIESSYCMEQAFGTFTAFCDGPSCFLTLPIL